MLCMGCSETSCVVFFSSVPSALSECWEGVGVLRPHPMFYIKSGFKRTVLINTLISLNTIIQSFSGIKYKLYFIDKLHLFTNNRDLNHSEDFHYQIKLIGKKLQTHLNLTNKNWPKRYRHPLLIY